MKRQVILFVLLFRPWSLSAVDLPKPDIVVAADDSGHFKTIQSALASVPKENRERIVVFVKDGTYREKIRVDASFITLHGQSRTGTRIEYPQSKDDFTAHPDAIGWAVINLNHADDFVLENLTAENTASTMSAHTFTISGDGNRIVVVDCEVLSHGPDTVSLGRGERGFYYHARCNFSGSVDFVCPRGWCYAANCNFYAYKKTAAVWHGGLPNADMKFVLRDCAFDGATAFILGRYFVDAQFYFLDCKFSAKMKDTPIRRIEGDIRRSVDLAKQNSASEHAFFYNCRRDGGDFDWFANNLSSAPGSPTPNQITAAWTFNGRWDPENESGPAIQQLRRSGRQITLVFNEPVTVKGKPRLRMCGSDAANYVSGSGGEKLLFELNSDSTDEVCAVDLNAGAIIACQASATLRSANLSLRAAQNVTAESRQRCSASRYTCASLRATSLRSSDRRQD